MLLAIDIGNTNTVFAAFSEGVLHKALRAETIARRSVEDHVAMLRDDFALNEVSAVIISSVVPDADEAIITFCRQHLEVLPLFVTSEVAGIDLDLDNPEEVGADRVVNARAVLEHYSAPAIVVDFGTATTFDVIDAQGRYVGGVIAPGINLALEALSRAAAKLPEIEVAQPEKVIGKNTKDAMRSGIYWGYVSLIEGIIKNICREMDGKPFVLATGGLAPLFAENTPVIEKVDQELTLKGLLSIYQGYGTA